MNEIEIKRALVSAFTEAAEWHLAFEREHHENLKLKKELEEAKSVPLWKRLPPSRGGWYIPVADRKRKPLWFWDC